MSCLEYFFSYSSASWASWILRSRLRWGSVMQRLRISCIVIVEPPWTTLPASMFSIRARMPPS